MKININLLENDFIPKVKKGKNNLEDAYDILAGATVPNDFSSTYRQKLKETKTSIGNLEDDLNDLKTYASEKVDNFEDVENKNEKLLESLILGIIVAASAVNTTTEITKNAIDEQTDNQVEDAWSSVSAYITQTVDDLKNWADEIILQASDWWTGAKEAASEWWSDVKDWASEAYEWTTGALETVGNCIFDMVSFVCTGVCALFADVVNVVFATIKGFANVVEGIIDAGTIVATAASTLVTGSFDIVNGIITGDWDFEFTTTMWKQTASFVAYDGVEEVYDWFYEDTAVGAWLNETAHSPVKTDGVVTGIAEGIGEVFGVIALAWIYGGGSAIVMSSIGGASAGGRYVESSWNEAKESAEEGEDWLTWSTWWSGMTGGLLTAAYETVAWYLGSEAFMSGIGSRYGRVLWDTFTGALDVPARSAITWLSSGGETSFLEAFNEEGGWLGILTNALIAGGLSTLFEYADYRKSKNTTNVNTDFNSTYLLDDGSGITTRSDAQITSIDDAIALTLISNGIEPTDAAIQNYRQLLLEQGYVGNSITRESGARAYAEAYLQEIQNGKNALSQFKSIMSTGKSSDTGVVDMLYDTINLQLSDGNIEAAKYIQTICDLKQTRPGISFQVTTGNSYCIGATVFLNETKLRNQSGSGTLIHETGHMQYYLISGQQLPSNVEDVFAGARVYSSNNGRNNVYDALSYAQNALNSSNKKAESQILDALNCSSKWDYVRLYASLTGEKAKILSKRYDDILKEEGERIFLTEYAGLGAFVDIVDALYLGTKTNLNRRTIKLCVATWRKILYQ